MLSLLVVLVGATAASAHGDLLEGSPGPGDQVQPGGTVLRLEFADVDGDRPAHVALLDAAGDPLAVGDAISTAKGTVCARSEPLTPGVRTIEYSATSTDGHQLTSRYQFEVSRNGTRTRPQACAGLELAAPGEARTLAEMTTAGTPVWVFYLLGTLVVVSGAGVILRVRHDRRAHGVQDAPR